MPTTYPLLTQSSVTLDVGETTTAVIPFSGRIPKSIYVPSDFSGTMLTPYFSDEAGGTFSPVRDCNGGLLQMTVVADSYCNLCALELLASPHMKLVSNVEQADTAATLRLTFLGA